jgi:hypothetical protein
MSSVNLVLKTSDLYKVNSTILNNSFESPVTNFKFYNDFTNEEKTAFKWNAGGNLYPPNIGPAITTNGDGFNFRVFTSRQALAIQSTSFIEQSLYLNKGIYELSLYFYSRNDTQVNPIIISIDSNVIATINTKVSNWTLYKIQFNLVNDGNILLKFKGGSNSNLTTGIDQIEIIQIPLTLLPPLLWQVNMETLLCHLYEKYDRFKICLQYIAGSNDSTKNLVVKLTGLPFQYVYNLGGKNNSTITIGTIKDKSFNSSYSLSPYYSFTRQAMANILIEFYDLENNVKDNTNIDCIFSFNIIGDENFKKIYRLI